MKLITRLPAFCLMLWGSAVFASGNHINHPADNLGSDDLVAESQPKTFLIPADVATSNPALAMKLKELTELLQLSEQLKSAKNKFKTAVKIGSTVSFGAPYASVALAYLDVWRGKYSENKLGAYAVLTVGAAIIGYIVEKKGKKELLITEAGITKTQEAIDLKVHELKALLAADQFIAQ